MTERWIVEARLLDETDFRPWRVPSTAVDAPMEPTTLEKCVDRVQRMVLLRNERALKWGLQPAIESRVIVRLRNLETDETIPAEVFGL